ncbi:hypothetical protein [Mycetocola sp.]|uniref:AraC-like ligand-binding domain-containing protein n=1 Tax=Mycetocola sp. TaxID=1871042 RepID=UPI003989AA2E
MDFPSASASTIPDMSLNVIKIGGVTAAANYHVDMPVAGRARMQAGPRNPVYGTPQTAALFAPGLPVDLDCDDQFTQIALMLPKTVLQLELESLLGHSLRAPLEFSKDLDPASAPGCIVLQAILMIDSARLARPLSSFARRLTGIHARAPNVETSRICAQKSTPMIPWTSAELS